MHDGLPGGANRRRQELLKCLLADPVCPVDKFVLIAPPDVPPPAADPRVVIERHAGHQCAIARFFTEPALLGKIVKKHNAGLLMQESFPVPRPLPVPVLLTIHDLRDFVNDPRVAPRGFLGLRSAMAPRVIEAGIRSATSIVSVSHFTKDALVARFPAAAAKMIVVPNAADHLRDPGPSTEKRDPRLILYVGHLEKRKGADVLLEGFLLLHKKDPAAELHWCGRGPLRGSIAARAAADGAADRVIFHDQAGDAELIHLYQKAGVVAIPSRYEGFCIPLLEALRFGAPVVAARTSALPEIAGDAALFVDSMDPAAWAQAIETALAPGRASISAERATQQSKKYSWKHSAHLLALCITRTAAARGAR